jgi:hypothetical protein
MHDCGYHTALNLALSRNRYNRAVNIGPGFRAISEEEKDPNNFIERHRALLQERFNSHLAVEAEALEGGSSMDRADTGAQGISAIFSKDYKPIDQLAIAIISGASVDLCKRAIENCLLALRFKLSSLEGEDINKILDCFNKKYITHDSLKNPKDLQEILQPLLEEDLAPNKALEQINFYISEERPAKKLATEGGPSAVAGAGAPAASAEGVKAEPVSSKKRGRGEG